MDFSSSSSSSSHYRSSAFPANTSRPSRWDLPIYESTPHFPPQEISSSMQDSGRLASSTSPSYSSYAYSYSNYNYGGGGASTAGREVEMAEKREEGGDRPPGESSTSSAAAEVEREHMFDKVVTPSDVGKLNRLVIPKQHAEKYFPLDSSTSDKGLLLDFEDRNGKSWRFRYSYWNSSQSYVMTKGWSRFVKEKKLDAGDVVSFQRGLGETAKDRFYIDWRRRPGVPPPPPHHHIQFQHGFSLHHRSNNIHHPPFLLAGQQPPPPLPPPPLVLHHPSRDPRQLMSPNHHRGSVISYNGLGNAATSSGYNEDNSNYGVLTPNFCHQGSVVYMRGPPQHQMQMQMELVGASRRNQTTSPASGAASDEPNPMVLDSVPVVPKRLRLFGVNMDCTVDQDSEVNPADVNPVDVNPTVVMSTHSCLSAEGADGSLQLRLHGAAMATPSSSSMQTTTTDFLDKGKSSMTLDFDL